MHKQKFNARTNSRGFTLIELIIVVVVLGIVAAVLIRAMTGSTDGAKAQAISEVTEKAVSSWQLLNQVCGTNSAYSGNPLPATGKTVSDVIFGGSANVADAYKVCYASSTVKALTEAGQPGSASGKYNVQGFEVSFTDGGTSPSKVSFASVPDPIVLAVARKYTPGLATLAASDATSSVVQYSVAGADNTRTLTLIKQ